MTIIPDPSATTTPRPDPLGSAESAVTFADLPHGALAVLIDGVTVLDRSLAAFPSTAQLHVDCLAAMERHVARLVA